jgi:hypothetical protein
MRDCATFRAGTYSVLRCHPRTTIGLPLVHTLAPAANGEILARVGVPC